MAGGGGVELGGFGGRDRGEATGLARLPSRQGADTLHNLGTCHSLPDHKMTRDTCMGLDR